MNICIEIHLRDNKNFLFKTAKVVEEEGLQFPCMCSPLSQANVSISMQISLLNLACTVRILAATVYSPSQKAQNICTDQSKAHYRYDRLEV